MNPTEGSPEPMREFYLVPLPADIQGPDDPDTAVALDHCGCGRPGTRVRELHLGCRGPKRNNAPGTEEEVISVKPNHVLVGGAGLLVLAALATPLWVRSPEGVRLLAEELLALGAARVLDKPFRLEEVVEALGKLCGRPR